MKTAALILALFGLAVAGTASAAPGDDLLKKSGCTACHANDKKVIGPAYFDVAAKYKNDAATVAKLSAKVKSGGAGVWGPVAMTPHPHLKDEDIKTMVSYILTLKK